MTDETVSSDQAYIRRAAGLPERPPASTYGPFATLRRNLFATRTSAILTFVSLALVALVLPELLRFLVIDAVWRAPDGAACRVAGTGACWPFIVRKLPYFIYGSYPLDQRWRVDLVLAVGAFLIAWLLWLGARGRRLAAYLFFVAYPIFGFVLLYGVPGFGLRRVDTDLWGGIFVSLLVAVVGIVVSLPLGVLLALRAPLAAAGGACPECRLHRNRPRRPR